MERNEGKKKNLNYIYLKIGTQFLFFGFWDVPPPVHVLKWESIFACLWRLQF